jgi:hypothetical protein
MLERIQGAGAVLVHSDLAHFPAVGEIVIFDRSDEAPIEDRRWIEEKF